MFPISPSTVASSESFADANVSAHAAERSQHVSERSQSPDRLSLHSSASRISDQRFERYHQTLLPLERTVARTHIDRPLADVPTSPTLSAKSLKSFGSAWSFDLSPYIRSNASSEAGSVHSVTTDSSGRESATTDSSFEHDPQHYRLLSSDPSSHATAPLLNNVHAAQAAHTPSATSSPSVYSQESLIPADLLPVHELAYRDGVVGGGNSQSSEASSGHSPTHSQHLVMPEPNMNLSPDQNAKIENWSQNVAKEVHLEATMSKLTGVPTPAPVPFEANPIDNYHANRTWI